MARYDKSHFDLELAFYAKILNNDMLHWGWFNNPDVLASTISIGEFEQAQCRYADEIIKRISDHEHPILDAGCGMGGLTNLLSQRGFDVEALTPNNNQIEHIKKVYIQIPYHACRLEDLQSEKQYGTLVNAESLQYINLDDAFKKAKKILLPQGRWIITDYFRLHDSGLNQSGHLLSDFREHLRDEDWVVLEDMDITARVLPTIRFIKMYADRFLLPLFVLGSEKLHYKKAWLYYLTSDVRKSVAKKIEKELASVDPEAFLAEKQYRLFVLKKEINKGQVL